MARRHLGVFWIGAMAVVWPALGQAQAPVEASAIGAWPERARGSSLGLNPARVQYALPCSLGSIVCAGESRLPGLAGEARSERWALELGYGQIGRLERAAGAARAEGLSLSLVGKAPLGASWGVFGRVGTTWGRADAGPAALAPVGADSGFGLSWGAGLSWELSPRATATLGWESYDLRFGGGRDPVRATSLGLQWRY